MPEKIGKYHIVERIGRGGMGVVYKAHDPILDRPVALKVISPDVEVTDELRARFFREAQACARLSHPNIVTVYDMGEEDGRLFFVMELLDGEELRRLISQRTSLALEDKLTVMGQVCDGLAYAHERGVVHRDIKPGNILLQRNGQVKILDFGIAQMATTDGGLTRTGLIMGTLRYIAPEQIRGRADARSDQFSVGAVFYEFLSFRPPFTGDDPIQLIEQLRADDPPALQELDPTIPPDVAAIVARAMRKDPAERFPDLRAMRAELEAVQRRLTDEAQGARRRIQEHIDQVRALRMSLAERVGGPAPEQALPVLTERARLDALQAMDRDLAGQIDALRAMVADAEALAPGVQRGMDLMAGGEFLDAILEFEAVVARIPEHHAALQGLERARREAEAQRRAHLAAKLLQDARAALEDAGYALCLELLHQAADLSAIPDRVAEMEGLRQKAEEGLIREEATRRARQEAEREREQWAHARQRAQAVATPDYAPTLWAEAEARAADGHAAMAREAYAEAHQAFGAAASVYPRFEEAARAAQRKEREAAEQAREQMAQARARAQEAGAPHYARELWDTAEAKASEAPAALASSRGRDLAAFHEAIALYRRSLEAAQQARARERQQAEDARDRMVRTRQSAAALEAERVAPAPWREAAAKAAEAEAALAAEQFPAALAAFDAARGLYRDADTQAREVQRAQRQQAEQARQSAMALRQTALTGEAATHAPSEWAEAEASLAAGDTDLARDRYLDAAAAFDRSAALYRQADARAREVAQARAEAERAREAATRAREVAQAVATPDYAPTLWAEAEARAADGHAAMAREAYAEAHQAFGAAASVYPRFEEAARAAQRKEREAAEQAREQMAQARARAQEAGAPHYAGELWGTAEAKAGEAPAALASSRNRDLAAFHEAIALYRRSLEAAQQARAHERQEAEEARDRMVRTRQSAASLDAEHVAPAPWREAAAKAAEAEAALAAEQFPAAIAAFDAARGLYRDADTQAREIQRAQRQQAEQARQSAMALRQTALTGEAATHAPSEWAEAEASVAAGDADLARDRHLDAAAAFDRSTALYRQAHARAQEVAQARAEAERAREAVTRARRAASQAQATRYAAEPWQAAESAATRAGDALGRQDYKDAQLLFTEARRLYAGAAQTAGAAAEAEARLVEAMLGDAKRLLQSLELTACMRRLNDVLALRPGHEVAERLREQAEDTRRRIEAEREAEAAPHARESEAPDATVLTPSPTETGSAPTVLAEPPPPVVEPMPAATPTPAVDDWRPPLPAERPEESQRVAAVEPAAPGDAPTVLWESAPVRPVEETTEATVYAPSPQPLPPAPVLTRPAPVSAQRTTKARAGRSPKIAAIAVGGLVAAGLVVFYAIPRTQPPAPAPPPMVQTRPTPPPVPAPAPVKPPEPAPAQPAAPPPVKQSEPVPGPDLKVESAAKPPGADQPPAPAPREVDVPAPRDRGLERRIAEIQVAAARVEKARKEAEAANARRLAQSSWAEANAAQRKAEAAQKRGALDEAHLFFADAEKTFQTAAKVAGDRASSDADRARKAAAEQAHRGAEQARKEADQAGAPRLAPSTFGSAQQKQKDGDNSFERKDFTTAQRRFQEAQQAYMQASQEAKRAAEADERRRAGIQRQQGDADQARGRVVGAREAATQAGAARHAPRLLAAAQAKEREAGAAFGRSDYAEAARLFGEAQADYDAAAQAARREAEADQARERQVASLRSGLDRSRTRAEARREDALKAEADRLAKDLYDAGRQKESEAEGLATRQNLMAATQAYDDAGQRYLEAASRAHGIREARGQADGAKTRMLAEKQRAHQAAPEFASALAEEGQAASFYERRAYREAAEKFRSAELLYARAKPAPPAPKPEAPPQPPPSQPPPRRPPPPSF